MYYSRLNEDFEEISVIGDGSFGKVTKCKHRFDGMFYAVKRTKKQIKGPKDLHNIMKEVHALAALVDNPYIVRYFAAWIEEDRLYLQTELCEGGSLANQIKAKVKFSETQLIELIRQVLSGIQQMHSQHIVHLDIKPENIYIKSNENYKIGDLGLASSSLKEFKDVIEGDSRYLCRELLAGDMSVSNPDLTKADIFALGMTIYECATLSELPNNGDNWHQLRDGHLNLPGNFSQDFVKLLKLMMHPDPAERPTAQDMLQHHLRSLKKPTFEELMEQNLILEAMLNRAKEREQILTQLKHL
ncbi:Wee1-like protein kinase [Acrasis kona]|uniref:Wee1-like protein kinase n=1 Tax=Acrasis kona TaxID=1008807 RepID=A0AAW2ZI25_9EUKA